MYREVVRCIYFVSSFSVLNLLLIPFFPVHLISFYSLLCGFYGLSFNTRGMVLNRFFFPFSSLCSTPFTILFFTFSFANQCHFSVYSTPLKEKQQVAHEKFKRKPSNLTSWFTVLNSPISANKRRGLDLWEAARTWVVTEQATLSPHFSNCLWIFEKWIGHCTRHLRLWHPNNSLLLRTLERKYFSVAVTEILNLWYFKDICPTNTSTSRAF